jgi:hypothetical protein
MIQKAGAKVAVIAGVSPASDHGVRCISSGWHGKKRTATLAKQVTDKSQTSHIKFPNDHKRKHLGRIQLILRSHRWNRQMAYEGYS